MAQEGVCFQGDSGKGSFHSLERVRGRNSPFPPLSAMLSRCDSSLMCTVRLEVRKDRGKSNTGTCSSGWLSHTWSPPFPWTLSVTGANISPNILTDSLGETVSSALVERPMCQKTTYTRVGKPGQQHVSPGAPFAPPAKGDKWDTVLGNLWAWDQFGRQGGGVKLHILLIERAVSHRDTQMWKREALGFLKWDLQGGLRQNQSSLLPACLLPPFLVLT